MLSHNYFQINKYKSFNINHLESHIIQIKTNQENNKKPKYLTYFQETKRFYKTNHVLLFHFYKHKMITRNKNIFHNWNKNEAWNNFIRWERFYLVYGLLIYLDKVLNKIKKILFLKVF